VLLLITARSKNVSAVRARLCRRLANSFGWKQKRGCRRFIFEPVVGATLGAAVPRMVTLHVSPKSAAKNEILLIADEIMTGMGRAGKPFAVQHWGIEPDLI